MYLHCKPHPAIPESQINYKFKICIRRFTGLHCLYDLINDWTTEVAHILTALKLTLHITQTIKVSCLHRDPSLRSRIPAKVPGQVPGPSSGNMPSRKLAPSLKQTIGLFLYARPSLFPGR
jgi:hypothetical protein